MKLPGKTYIGDGIYADWDGYALTLTTENGISVTNQIIIEPREWRELERYISAIVHAQRTEDEESVR